MKSGTNICFEKELIESDNLEADESSNRSGLKNEVPRNSDFAISIHDSFRWIRKWTSFIKRIDGGIIEVFCPRFADQLNSNNFPSVIQYHHNFGGVITRSSELPA